VATGRKSVENLVADLAYKNSTQIHKFLAGKIPCIRGNQKIALDALLATLDQGDAQSRPEPVAQVIQLPTATATQPPSRTLKEKEVAVTLLIATAQALQALADVAVSNAFTPADREDMRWRAGLDTFFRLKNTLSGLCGERARDLLPAKGRGKP